MVLSIRNIFPSFHPLDALRDFTNERKGKLACTGWPRSRGNLRFLADEGITHLVTLSRETRPLLDALPNGMDWTEIPVREFQAATTEEIDRSIDICEKAQFNGDGPGRTGVMAACYLTRFQDLAPERAIINLRLMRPGSVETYEQERAVAEYHDALRGMRTDLSINRPPLT